MSNSEMGRVFANELHQEGRTQKLRMNAECSVEASNSKVPSLSFVSAIVEIRVFSLFFSLSSR